MVVVVGVIGWGSMMLLGMGEGGSLGRGKGRGRGGRECRGKRESVCVRHVGLCWTSKTKSTLQGTELRKTEFPSFHYSPLLLFHYPQP